MDVEDGLKEVLNKPVVYEYVNIEITLLSRAREFLLNLVSSRGS